MSQDISVILKGIEQELKTLFAAHKSVGLKGHMCLYTTPTQELFRSKEAGLKFWFTEEEIPEALKQIETHYNGGKLPNSPLLLNPLIHKKGAGDTYTPEGSGIVWATVFSLGVEAMKDEQRERIVSLGGYTSNFHRAENKKAGLKTLVFSAEKLAVLEDGVTVSGCKELFNVADSKGEQYAPYYLLSGLTYLCIHGAFEHPDFASMFDKEFTPERIVKNTVKNQKLLDASQCFDAYDRHHSLYTKFGIDPKKIDNNLKFYNLCARDVKLFDATGVKHTDAETMVGFDFIVDGWVPRGAVTVIGATGGTGKSSLAHNLAIKASIDYEEGETLPTWLGSKINFEKCKGICVYFSGEDGPAIVQSRAKVYDPQGRSHRLMFQRTDFGEGGTLASFLKKLHALPDVPLIVIDPARKYLTGDENDAGVVSDFFEAIEEFAIQKHAAMVVVHHLVKGAKVQHVSEIYDMLRGSQVFIDRPRVVIGMYREGKYTIAGLAKNNIPPQLGMIQGERVYVRDPERLELVLLPGKEGMRLDTFSEEELEEITAAEPPPKKTKAKK